MIYKLSNEMIDQRSWKIKISEIIKSGGDKINK